MSDFGAQFKSISDSIGQAAQGVLNKLDQWSFRMLVDNLKGSDYEAVKESIDQLAKEKKPLAIPPLFFVSKEHPNPYIREAAEKALHEFGKDKEIKDATDGKPIDDATKHLIEKFGNFRS